VVLAAGILSSMAAAKMVGFGLALVVMLDAFVIRGTLVPALMKLAGSANWWAPRPLRRLHKRIGITEHVVVRPFDYPAQLDDEAVAEVAETYAGLGVVPGWGSDQHDCTPRGTDP
jgi:uncharacterized membrane protein YdfJ with MMPL/SSD domain